MTSRTLFEQQVCESSNVWDRCDVRANARQIREIADCDMPLAAAIDLVDQ